MRCWSCARVARRKRTLDSLSEQPPRYRPRYRLRPGLYAACLQPVSAECCKPHFSVQPADGLTHLFRRAPARASSWCRCLPGAGMQPACAVFPAGFGVQSGFRASPARLGHAGKLALGARGHGHERGLRAFGSRADRGQVLGTCDGHAVEGLLASSAALARPAALPSIRAPTTNSLISQALLSQLIYIKLRFRQGSARISARLQPSRDAKHDLQERALAAARQPSPAFQPPAWPRGTPPTVCPSGP